jgi:hypothetical protein
VPGPHPDRLPYPRGPTAAAPLFPSYDTGGSMCERLGRRYYERPLRSTIHESDPGDQGRLHKGVQGLCKMGRTVREGGHHHDPRRLDRG